jgi:hypothetical protein
LTSERLGLRAAGKRGGLLAASVGTLIALHAAAGLPQASPVTAAPTAAVTLAVPRPPRTAEFGAITPAADVRWLADWIADTGDNGGASFFLVDKRTAQLHVFDADARRVASTAVLLGAAIGDDSVPGIGTRPMAQIRLAERTTPAGRFIGERGKNSLGEDVIWVDYGAAVSMHRVRLTIPSEHRAERLASPSPSDNRISYGCINVPVAFYNRYVGAVFAKHRANIYVLPEVKAVREVFAPSAARR